MSRATEGFSAIISVFIFTLLENLTRPAGARSDFALKVGSGHLLAAEPPDRRKRAPGEQQGRTSDEVFGESFIHRPSCRRGMGGQGSQDSARPYEGTNHPHDVRRSHRRLARPP
ncbi:hypothetical protein G6F50_018076 [Rhizopus delemar]|uniref:Secreted protein n=1 Tax=Rhizopus delemar TaxID=936053 RepID=A0A9P6XNG7_9FUNG|nr:hypothetical protein G6F50_018076 [Rhizopus delemar]